MANHAQITVKRVNRHLLVSITDDGTGFDTSISYYNGGETKGHGLSIMQERADSIGGKLRISSTPMQGTEIQIEVPIGSIRRKTS